MKGLVHQVNALVRQRGPVTEVDIYFHFEKQGRSKRSIKDAIGKGWREYKWIRTWNHAANSWQYAPRKGHTSSLAEFVAKNNQPEK